MNTIFQNISDKSLKHFENNGYSHYRFSSKSLTKEIGKCFEYYSNSNLDNQEEAFKNATGKPRHYVDIFRDKNSPALKVFRNSNLSKLINFHKNNHGRYIFTHSKMSFKQIKSKGDWRPHQDNGYKKKNDLRDGFAIFVCLEDMDKNNGCLQIYPKSHKLGLLKHTRVIEDIKSGDNQLYIKKIPSNLHPLPIKALKGDIIIFSTNTIHRSFSSKNSSKRLSLIAEIEEFKKIKLDDYGKLPLFALGNVNYFESSILYIKFFFTPLRFWKILKKFP